MKKPKAMVLHAAGTNRDPDAVTALELAGAEPEIVHVNQLRSRERRWSDYAMLIIPGGFSYADALGAGRLFALDLSSYFEEEVAAFIDAGRPVLGICNGFQTLVKSGILPGRLAGTAPKERIATLAHNEGGRFECRWTTMTAPSSSCIWTKELTAPLSCPVAHGEGRFLVDGDTTLERLRAGGRIALIYADAEGNPARGAYPANPNGSVADIAGICNETGTVLGLMPHPENNVVARSRGGLAAATAAGACLALWKNGVRYANES